MMTQLRTFTYEGIETFRFLIDEERNKGNSRQVSLVDESFIKSVEALAFDPEYTEVMDADRGLETNRSFSDRYDMGAYLNDELPADISLVQHTNVGLWSWISALYFRQLVEANKKTDRFKLWSSYRYVPLGYQKFRYYRHLAFMNFWLHRTMGKDVAKFFLSRPLYEHSDAIEQLYTQDRDFLTSAGLMQAALEMYMDPKTGRMKSKALGEATGGSARRLATKIAKQLQMNFDLQSMTKDEIYPLLPAEFDSWKMPPIAETAVHQKS